MRINGSQTGAQKNWKAQLKHQKKEKSTDNRQNLDNIINKLEKLDLGKAKEPSRFKKTKWIYT